MKRPCAAAVLLLLCRLCWARKLLRGDDCLSLNSSSALPAIGCLLCSSRMRSASKTEKRRMLTEVSDKFEDIYSKEEWGREGGGSGVGSDPDSAYHTGYLIELLMYKYGLVSLLDAPCGGVHSSWTRHFIARVHRVVPCFRYHGVDAAASVISKNKETFDKSKWMSFAHLDLSDTTYSLADSLKSRFDLILSRDALQHLSYRAIAGVLRQYCSVGASYLLLGSYLDANTGKNEDIAIGDAFCINVRIPPFSFPEPLEIIREAVLAESRKYLLLYKLDVLCADFNLLSFVETHASASRRHSLH